MVFLRGMNHHLSNGLKIQICIFKKISQELVYSYGSVQAGIDDGSSSSDILYINFGTGCWVFPRHQHWHFDTTPPNIWDCIESYTMHIFWTAKWVLICLPQTESLFKRTSLTYTGSATRLYLSAYLAECLGHFEFKTLLSLSSAFCESHFFLYQAIQPVLRAELDWRLEFCFLQSFFFRPPRKRHGFYEFRRDLLSRDLCWVPHSGSTPRWVPPSRLSKDWRILSAQKGSWAVGHLSRTPTNGSCDHQGSAGNLEDQASQWVHLQHVHLLPREHQGRPCACHCSSTSHLPKGTQHAVEEAGQGCWQAGLNDEESPESCWVQD